jgi:hypothetical protein
MSIEEAADPIATHLTRSIGPLQLDGGLRSVNLLFRVIE